MPEQPVRLDHSQCRITTTLQWEQHDCPPCPHGLLRGFLMTLTDDPAVNSRQREMKVRTLDRLTCADASHVEALSRMRAADA